MIRFYIVVCALLLDLLFHAYRLQPFSLFSVGLLPQYKHEFSSMSINCRTAQGNLVGPFKFTKTHWHFTVLLHWSIYGTWCGWFGPDRLGESNTEPWARAGRLARQKRSWETVEQDHRTSSNSIMENILKWLHNFAYFCPAICCDGWDGVLVTYIPRTHCQHKSQIHLVREISPLLH